MTIIIIKMIIPLINSTEEYLNSEICLTHYLIIKEFLRNCNLYKVLIIFNLYLIYINIILFPMTIIRILITYNPVRLWFGISRLYSDFTSTAFLSFIIYIVIVIRKDIEGSSVWSELCIITQHEFITLNILIIKHNFWSAYIVSKH